MQVTVTGRSVLQYEYGIHVLNIHMTCANRYNKIPSYYHYLHVSWRGKRKTCRNKKGNVFIYYIHYRNFNDVIKEILAGVYIFVGKQAL